ncbi:MAG: YceI family protein [Cytophagaceae bacterium]|nr:YceI family protein [Cytophagaceae bacterium]
MKISHVALTAAIAFSALAFTAASITFKVDKTKSKVTWIARKVTGEHTGTVNIADGKLTSDGKNILGGSFDIDMNTITCADLTDADYNGKLIGHLKSDDFFSVAKFPKSTLAITKATSTGNGTYKINGNLTIKGITQPIEFPATVTISATQVTAKAKILVDRTKYDIKYGSASFFDSLGDKAINNEFELNVDLVAKK